MSVVDLRGPAAGDPTGLAALAAELRSAVAVLTDTASTVPTSAGTARALLRAGVALDEAATELRCLPRPVPAGAVEAVEVRLAHRLREVSEILNHESGRTQVV